MAYEDLKEHNIFLPEEAWGKVDLGSSVNELALVGCYLLGIASCVMMAVGNGKALTWVGVLGFLVFMFLFTLVSNAGIEKQNKAIRELMEDTRKSTSKETEDQEEQIAKQDAGKAGHQQSNDTPS